MSNIRSNPGISDQVLMMLKSEVEKDPANYGNCSLMLDGMAILKHLHWDPKRKEVVGFVDLGACSLDGDAGEATEALVVMAVGIRVNESASWVFF